ncbi:MAG: histidine--tRNA ligase [Bacteroidetes bacterium]|jgi:histidyl-tRNA synthetase|nr:histidine--tRNA ligase [Bacteroidota bacterium]MBT5530470.1 histidine--tRNA ligase [Cytophagia bacterium]MBT3423119.1 histidine--tRNA ligase [Bacteroidota bacterium]MBT3800944.1 histidine--tRNA ligase [Bacteroidota bacterium]MBT3935823.1 histidine--tRNA ligase [Bacteroidota bacterium]
MAKTSTPKGFRDFNPMETSRRNYIFKTIESVFKLYGYHSIETPAMENLSTLTGKYGEEGDKLLFKVLNSGDYLGKLSDVELASKQSNKLTSKIAEKGLRYDLTVPFARYVVEHFNDITFPFKRYQIQPVWRADRPQKGRYREFYQCDVDVIGSNSLLNEVELIQIIHDVFAKLGISVKIKLNNRKVLQGIMEAIGESDKFIDITIAIDKLDKIGIDKVEQELIAKELSQTAIDQLKGLLTSDESSNKSKIDMLTNIAGKTEIGAKGIAEIQTIINSLEKVNCDKLLEIDLTLARGLNYYTGAIIEVAANDIQIGSICGGGRYDDLTGIFGLKDMSGVGISFGADRIYDVLNELDAFPSDQVDATQLLFVNFGEKEAEHCLPLLQQIRNAGIRAELYPDNAKMKKQMSYADKLNIPYVVIIGDDEMKNELYSLKNMKTGEQQKLNIQGVINEVNA